jgi:hypothetical protein
MSMSWRNVLGVVTIPIVLFGMLIMAPGSCCKLVPLLGDEGQGECLGLVAKKIGVSRCRVLSALMEEIKGDNNDVVISSGLEGFVAAKACDELALLWTELPISAPTHVRPLVASAIRSCRKRENPQGTVNEQPNDALDIGTRARRSRCH